MAQLFKPPVNYRNNDALPIRFPQLVERAKHITATRLSAVRSMADKRLLD